jgi:hypothetical protein
VHDLDLEVPHPCRNAAGRAHHAEALGAGRGEVVLRELDALGLEDAERSTGWPGASSERSAARRVAGTRRNSSSPPALGLGLEPLAAPDREDGARREQGLRRFWGESEDGGVRDARAAWWRRD